MLKTIEAKLNPNVFYYFDGRDFDELNYNVKKAVERKSITAPKNFNKKKGLTKEPIELESEHTIGL